MEPAGNDVPQWDLVSNTLLIKPGLSFISNTLVYRWIEIQFREKLS